MSSWSHDSEPKANIYNSWDFGSRISRKISVIGVQDLTPVADPLNGEIDQVYFVADLRKEKDSVLLIYNRILL